MFPSGRRKGDKPGGTEDINAREWRGLYLFFPLAFIAKFVFMWGPRGQEPRKGENTAGGVGDGEDMGGLRCALSIIA